MVALDVHKFSIVAAVLPPAGADRRSRGLRGPRRRSAGLSSVWEPLRGWRSAIRQAQARFALWRLLASMGVAFDVIAPSLVPGPDRGSRQDRPARGQEARRPVPCEAAQVRGATDPGDRGAQRLLRCRDDIRCARTAARHRVAKQLLRHGPIFRDGKKAWTLQHRAWSIASSGAFRGIAPLLHLRPDGRRSGERRALARRAHPHSPARPAPSRPAGPCARGGALRDEPILRDASRHRPALCADPRSEK